MERWLLFLLPLIISTIAIRVPVDNIEKEETEKTESAENSDTNSNPVYYIKDKEEIDSYLIPPDPHKQEEVLPDSVVTPATYLLPPAVDQKSEYYYAPTESSQQSDWYPIAQEPIQDQMVKLLPPRPQTPIIPIFFADANETKPFEVNPYLRGGKALNVRIPSIRLEPPSEDAPNDYKISTPSEELELPAEEIDQPFAPPPLVSQLLPPKQFHRKYKNPTHLYPKKFYGPFKPVPIPISDYSEESSGIPKAKPVKYFKPLPGADGLILPPLDEKKVYLYQEAEKKRKLKELKPTEEPYVLPVDNYNDVPATEQDVSETNYRHPGLNRPHPELVRPRPSAAPQKNNLHPAPDNRTEFRMHGMKGPHSYQFGYDTGKGKNRQFRYEERDNDGLVRGHYGYMDRQGKLRVVNYRAHPELGFQAEPQEETKEE